VVVRVAAPLTARRKLAIAGGGVGLIAIAVGAVLVVDAESLESSARGACASGAPCHDLDATRKSERAVSRADLAGVVGAVGLVAVGASVALWVIGRPRDGDARHAKLVPSAADHAIALSIVGGF
jgi:hypothetical protein